MKLLGVTSYETVIANVIDPTISSGWLGYIYNIGDCENLSFATIRFHNGSSYIENLYFKMSGNWKKIASGI